MAGVAGDTGRSDVRLPVGIDVSRHLQHAPCDHFPVEAVVGEVFDVVTISAALLGCDPLGDRQHGAGSSSALEVGEHPHVLVDVGPPLPPPGGPCRWGPERVRPSSKFGVGRRIGNLLHGQAAIAALDGWTGGCVHPDLTASRRSRGRARRPRSRRAFSSRPRVLRIRHRRKHCG